MAGDTMGRYLTIGEVAKIKRISLKSLRYYEKIGILKPAWINPENGYRYYNSDQLLAIDMIKFLNAMDIPLKEWHDFIDEEKGFDLRGLIESSKAHAYSQIDRWNGRLNKLKLAEQGLADHEKYQSCCGFYERWIGERNLLCYPLEQPESQIEFHEKLSILFELAEEYQVTANYPSGVLMDYAAGEQHFYAYLEIYETLDGHPFYRHFPEHAYRCRRREQKSILHIVQEEPEYFENHPYTTIVEADCISSPMQFRPYPTELQFYYT